MPYSHKYFKYNFQKHSLLFRAMTFFHNNSISYKTSRFVHSCSGNQKSDAPTNQLVGSRSPSSYVVTGKEQRSPNTQHSALQRIMNLQTTNIQLLMRFFFLNIKRNILYKSKHKGSIMKREKTSHKLEEAGYSILLCLCGGRNTRSRLKPQHLTPQLCGSQQVS